MTECGVSDGYTLVKDTRGSSVTISWPVTGWWRRDVTEKNGLLSAAYVRIFVSYLSCIVCLLKFDSFFALYSRKFTLFLIRGVVLFVY